MINFLQPTSSDGSSASIIDINRHGTPKNVPAGQSRACYALCSYNTTTGSSGVVWYDRFFQPVVGSSYAFENNNYLASNGTPFNTALSTSGNMSNAGYIFYCNAGTQSNPSSSATYIYGNATNAAGEFGNSMTEAFSNGTIVSTLSRYNAWNIKHFLNSYAFNSDHKNKRIVYLIVGTVIRGVDRLDGSYSYSREDLADYTLPDASGSMYGSATYNNVRKELVYLDYVASGGQYKIVTYTGIDFDKYPSPADAFTASGVTKTVIATYTFPSWQVEDNESSFNPKIVLTDNGSLFISIMFTSNSFSMYKLIRAVGNASVTSCTLQQNLSTTTSYGKSSGICYGQRFIQSRDMNNVLVFCPYAYYGSGIEAYFVSKRFNNYSAANGINTADTNYGYQPVQYGDSGFTAWYAGNGYSSNATSVYITGFIDINYKGVIGQSGSNIYLQYFPLPNTTNYPFLTQVTDYSLLDDQSVIS